ncbi:MAG: Hpt domain-containing protein [Myxococcota bacterium]
MPAVDLESETMQQVAISAPHALDGARVEEATGGDPDFIRELLGLYLEDAAERIGELGTAVRAHDATALVNGAHKLKGSSANVGAVRVSELAKMVEAKGRAQEFGAAGELVLALRQELARVAPALERFLSDR